MHRSSCALVRCTASTSSHVPRCLRRAALASTTLAIVVGAIGSTALPAAAAKKPVVPSLSR